MAPVPGVSVTTSQSDNAVLADADPGSYYAPGFVVAAGYGPLKPGDTIGLLTSGGLAAPQKRAAITAVEADTTLIETITVAQAAGFKAGDVCDIVDGTNDSSELFSDLTIESVDYAAKTITFTAALGAGVLDATDWIRLKTVDGAEAAKAICLDHVPVPAGSTVTQEASTVRGLIAGRVKTASIPQIAADTYNIATELKTAALAGGVTSVGV